MKFFIGALMSAGKYNNKQRQFRHLAHMDFECSTAVEKACPRVQITHKNNFVSQLY